MKNVAVALLVLLCGSASVAPASVAPAGPALRAETNAQGVLTIRGDGWHPCATVHVSLPSAPGTNFAIVSAGSFTLEYPAPCEGGYGGRVVANQPPCRGKIGLRAETDIH